MSMLPADRPTCRYCGDTGFVTVTRRTVDDAQQQVRFPCNHTRWSKR